MRWRTAEDVPGQRFLGGFVETNDHREWSHREAANRRRRRCSRDMKLGPVRNSSAIVKNEAHVSKTTDRVGPRLQMLIRTDRGFWIP